MPTLLCNGDDLRSMSSLDSIPPQEVTPLEEVTPPQEVAIQALLESASRLPPQQALPMKRFHGKVPRKNLAYLFSPDKMVAEHVKNYPERCTPDKLKASYEAKFVTDMQYDSDLQGLRVKGRTNLYKDLKFKKDKRGVLVHTLEKGGDAYLYAMDYLAYHQMMCEKDPIVIKSMVLSDELRFDGEICNPEILAVCSWPYGEPPSGIDYWKLEENFFLLLPERLQFRAKAREFYRVLTEHCTDVWDGYDDEDFLVD